MGKRILSLMLAAVMLLVLLPVIPMKASAVPRVNEWITDRSKLDGSYFTKSTKLAAKLNEIFDGNCHVYSDRNCTKPVDTAIGTSNVKNNGIAMYVGPYGGPSLMSGTSCWIYANGAYYSLFGWPSDNNNGGPNSYKLDLSSTSTNSATYANFKAWGVRQGVGAMIRTNRHSMIVMYYDEDYLVIMDGNGDGDGLVSVRWRTWDQVNYSISYIIQPKESYYYEEYPVCEHDYTDIGICTKCAYDYDFESTYDRADTGYYKVTAELGIALRTARPYTAAPDKTSVIPMGTEVEVLGYVDNAFGEDWYKISYNGKTGYTKCEYVEFVRYSEQEIECDLQSPEEGELVPQSSYTVGGMIKSKYPLKAVNAYIDGNKYASITLGKATYLNIQSSAINLNLRFADLEPGVHTLKLEACDIHRSMTTICTRNFITEGDVTNTGTPGKPVLTVTLDSTDDGTATFTWDNTANTSFYNMWIEKKSASGSWQDFEYVLYAKSGMTRVLPAGEYRVQLQAYNEGVWVEEISDWLYTLGDYVYVTVSCLHEYEDEITKSATCLSSGIVTHTCTQCGYVYEEELSATGHNYQNGVCTYCGSADLSAALASGSCGTNLKWGIYRDGTLRISGSGAMSDYSYASGVTKAPWSAYASQIKHVSVERGVTAIGTCAFYGLKKIESVSVSSDLKTVKVYAFQDCTGLKNVYYAGTAAQWSAVSIGSSNTSFANCFRQHNYFWIEGTSDFNSDAVITDADAVYLLRYTLFPEHYPIFGDGDVDSNGEVVDADAVYLLRYTLFPDSYPVYP